MTRHLIAACAIFASLGAANKPAPDLQHFITEPKVTAVAIKILQNNRPYDQAPGYFFLAPYKGDHGWGPQIFDDEGHLIWWGGDQVKIRGIDLHPCLVNSTEHNHLCYNDAVPYEQGGHSVGLIRFFKNDYTQFRRDFGAMNGLRGPDIHELNTPTASQGKTFIQDVYHLRKKDLSPWDGSTNGYILDGCFQEINILSREIVFQWCSLDHVDIDSTYIYLNGRANYTIPGLAGTGDSKNSGWDWFHINSVDKSSSGNYLVSSRHLNSILYVAGPDNAEGVSPGKVIWYLGGKKNNFEMQDGLNFSVQHTIRYYKEKTDKGMVVSLFNNAWEGQTKTAEASNGMVIDLDLENMRASLVSQFVQPHGLLAHDQGNLQMLPNGNGLVGWGHCNYFSEHAPTGEVLYYAQFGGKGDCDDQIGVPKSEIFFLSSFRVWKFPWRGYPKTQPKLVSFSPHCDNRTNLFISWNGATEVASWAIFGTNFTTPNTGNFKHLITIPKVGFETRKTVDFSRFIYAEALDKTGSTLSTSNTFKTFVPKPALECTSARCWNKPDVSDDDSIANNCDIAHSLLEQSGIMNLKFEGFDIGRDILWKICVPFAAIILLLMFTRNRWLSACARLRRGKPGVELKDP